MSYVDIFFGILCKCSATLHMFCNYLYNQFGCIVKIVRNYNALEFNTSDCQSFFADKGILYHTSCVDRPQQNGRVERKHRHLLEISTALRFQASLPLRFWGDYILTATYIINMLPIAMLGYKTPYKKLLHQPPKCDPRTVFGCLAFASNPGKVGDKFQPMGTPYVFLGCPPYIKGLQTVEPLD